MAHANEDVADEVDADASDLDEEVPPLRLTLPMARSVIKRWQANPEEGVSSASEVADEELCEQQESKKRATRKDRLRQQFERSINRGQQLWGTPARADMPEAEADEGRMHGEAVRAQINELRKNGTAMFQYRGRLGGSSCDETLGEWL